MTTRPLAGSRRPALDGVRAVAVVCFVIYHGQILWAGDERGASFLPGGFLGVDAFFVLSAFLITTLLLDEHRGHGRIAIRQFWARRGYRLLPALAIALAFSAFWLVTFAPHGPWRTESWHEWTSTLFYVNNWWHVLTPHAYPHYLSHAWSLSMEEQYYLVGPLLVIVPIRLGLSARATAVMLGALAGVSAIEMVVLEHAGASTARLYYSTDTRAQAFLIGAACAFAVAGGVFESDRARRVLKFAMVVGLVIAGVAMQKSVLATDGRGVFRGVFTVVALAWAAVIVGVVLIPDSVIARVFAQPPVRYTGRISYGIYLYHWPIMLVFWQFYRTWPEWPLIFVQCFVTYVVAALSFRFIEQPILARAARLRDARPRARAG